MKQYTVEVLKDEMGELILPLPEELLKKVKWEIGDKLSWEKGDNNSYILKKNEKSGRQLVLVETISVFRHRYVVETPVGKDDWALDTIVCDEAEELSQKHLDENIVSHRVITKDELMRIHQEDNDYIADWSEEKVYNSYVVKLADNGDIIK